MNGTRKAPFTITETLPQVSLADFELVSLRYDDQTRYISQFVDAANNADLTRTPETTKDSSAIGECLGCGPQHGSQCCVETKTLDFNPSRPVKQNIYKKPMDIFLLNGALPKVGSEKNQPQQSRDW